MQLRRITTVALVTALALSGVAEAKVRPPKPTPPSCLMVTDPAGDARPFAGLSKTAAAWSTVAAGDPSLDVVSADVASDGVLVTFAIRLKQLVAWAPGGAFSTGGRNWQASIHAGPDLNLSVGAYDGPLGIQYTKNFITGNFDYAKSEIRISAPVAKYPELNIKKGMVLSGLSIKTATVIQTDPSTTASYGVATGDQEDDATSTALYTVGKPSCLKVAL